MKLIKVLENMLINIFMRSPEEVSSVISFLDNKKNIFVPLENNQLEVVPIEDILYVHDIKSNLTIIKTVDVEYKYNNSVCNLIDFLSELRSSNFRIINNGVCVNLDKLVCYDSYYRKVYFSYDDDSDQNLFMIANGKAIDNIVKKTLGKERDLQLTKNKGVIFI